MNLFIMNLLRSKVLKHGFYKHVGVKTFIDTLICLIGIGYFYNVCIGCQLYYRYETIVYEWVIKMSIRVMFMTSSLHEIYLISNRYLILGNKVNWIVKLKLIYYIPILVIIPLAFCSPLYFIFSIKRSDQSSELFYWTWSVTTRNYLFRAYNFLIVIIENIIPLTVLIIMSVLCIREYKKRILIKSKIVIQSMNKNLKKSENSFTRITIILTILFIITRISDFISTLLLRGAYLFFLKNEILISVINLIRQLTFLLYFGLQSFNGLLYVKIDKNLRNLAKEQLSKIKVIYNFNFLIRKQ